MRPRIYIDTSVIGGCEDEEFQAHSRRRADKKFDAVAMMREIRDELSAQINGMTLEEELKWLASQEIRDPFLRRLRDKAAQQAAAGERAAPRAHTRS
jgi:hypothetical protein